MDYLFSLHMRDLMKRRVIIRAGRWRLLILVLLSTCAMAGLVVRANKKEMPVEAGELKPPVSAEPLAPAPPVRPMQSTPEAAELLILTPSGFVPSEITRPAGPFLLVVIDRSGLDLTTLQLTQEGTNLQSSQSQIQKAESQNVFDLKPGTYVYTEANHPDWTCFITITP